MAHLGHFVLHWIALLLYSPTFVPLAVTPMRRLCCQFWWGWLVEKRRHSMKACRRLLERSYPPWHPSFPLPTCRLELDCNDLLISWTHNLILICMTYVSVSVDVGFMMAFLFSRTTYWLQPYHILHAAFMCLHACTVVSRKRAQYQISAHPPLLLQFPAMF